MGLETISHLGQLSARVGYAGNEAAAQLAGVSEACPLAQQGGGENGLLPEESPWPSWPLCTERSDPRALTRADQTLRAPRTGPGGLLLALVELSDWLAA